MRTQHNRRNLRCRQRHHPQIPGSVSHRIRNIAHHLPREPRITILIRQTKRNATLRMRHHSPVSPIPAIGTTVQGINSSGGSRLGILIGENVVGFAVNGEGGVLDTVCVAAWNTAEMRVLTVDVVVCCKDGSKHCLIERGFRGQTRFLCVESPTTLGRLLKERKGSSSEVLTSIIKATNNITLNAILVVHFGEISKCPTQSFAQEREQE